MGILFIDEILPIKSTDNPPKYQECKINSFYIGKCFGMKEKRIIFALQIGKIVNSK